MSTISPSFNRNAFQARNPVAFGGAGNTAPQNNARFSGMDVLKGFGPGLLDSLSKAPRKPGSLNYIA